MRAMLVLWMVLGGLNEPGAAGARGRHASRYTFYRNMKLNQEEGTRRVFGGRSSVLEEYSPTCVLLDRYWTPRCSAAVVAPRWVLTAAHCVEPDIAYIMYNARHPVSGEGDMAIVQYLYRHPDYKVVQEDEGRGVDVTQLNHDVGLVRSRYDMRLQTVPKIEPLIAMSFYNPAKLKNKKVQVLGFGRTESFNLGEELFSVQLQVVACDRSAWFHCMCGTAPRDNGTGVLRSRGVCTGDSGGPVLYRGGQVGVTSMGPLECASVRSDPPDDASSVFTALYNYADLVNATIFDTDQVLRMRLINAAARRLPLPRVVLLLSLLTLLAGIIGERDSHSFIICVFDAYSEV